MNVIVPLSNENCFKLELDDINIPEELVCKVLETIGYEFNTDNYNFNHKSLSTNKIVFKLIELVKKSSNIGVFDVLHLFH